jgi:hypothetical protein
MPTDLFLIGAVLAVVAGGLMFVLINRSKPADPPRFFRGSCGLVVRFGMIIGPGLYAEAN